MSDCEHEFSQIHDCTKHIYQYAVSTLHIIRRNGAIDFIGFSLKFKCSHVQVYL